MAVSREMWTSSDCNSCSLRFRHLPLGQVADKAGEKALIAGFHFADGEFHREGRSVAALADDDAADADDAPLAGGQIAADVAVMLAAIGLGHQDLDVASDRLGGLQAEKPFSRGAE